MNGGNLEIGPGNDAFKAASAVGFVGVNAAR
jgi:hypothetical protein